MTKTYKMEDGRGRRLFADINHAFKKDPLMRCHSVRNIPYICNTTPAKKMLDQLHNRISECAASNLRDEYDFLPVMEPQHNASPLVVVEHKLGLELWSVHLLFRYAYNRLLNWRDKSQSSPFLDGQELSQLSRAVLLVNPDCYTAWNIRKELIESGDVTMTEDLNLGQLILTKFPKSAETFIHRRWLFQRLVNQCLSSSNDSCAGADSFHDNGGALLSMDGIDIALGPDLAVVANGNEAAGARHLRENRRANAVVPLECTRLLTENLQRELRVCEVAADGYSSNYYAWTHMAWIVRYCCNCSLQVILRELERTQSWTQRHISDHSGFHYRQFLLSSLAQHASRLHRQYGKSVSDLVDAEHDFVCDLIHTFPAHEALWYHRKSIFHMMMTSTTTKAGEVSTPVNRATPTLASAVSKGEGQKRSRLESHSPHALRQQEMDSVQKSLGQTKDSHQKALASKYVDWLEKVFPLAKDT